ncbi:MAG: TIR domain-containing protein [Clostridia bacterium]|nr:TIR domain-containing protein [Clostridia bacterium]
MITYLSNAQDITKSHYKLFCDFHQKDIGHFFKIKNDIFNICKCSIFYYENADGAPSEAEQEFEITRANLYVLIVSSRTLFSPDFDMRGYNIAVKNNIPILPILVENGLEASFNEKFGNLQCISTCLELVDTTAVPYIEKLRNFLTQSLSLSFNIDEIRSSFNATIFLSYRKKDRMYAQRLLDIIHSSDELKSIAVWYDEFLVPGENFDSNIKSELENSELFILMVTPSILEGQNYIKIVEYPVAQSLDKTILPIETVPTNAGELKSEYPELPETVSVSEAERLKRLIKGVLEKNGITINERSIDRDFFIGFAFLKGLYVEKNTSVAIEMIKKSADAGLTEAITTLVSIYKYGDGCEIDTEKAAAWQNKHIAQLLSCFENSQTEENAESVLEAYKELADIFTRGKSTASAATAFMEIVRFLNSSQFEGTAFAKLNSAEAYESAAALFIDEGDYSKARYGYIEKAIALREEIHSSLSVKNSALELINAYLLLAKCQFECDDIIGLKTTVKVTLKELMEKLLDYRSSSVHSETLQTLRKALFGLNSIGLYSEKLKLTEQAFIFTGAAVNLAAAINARYNSLSTNILAYNAFKNEGEQHIKINVENHLRAAERAFTPAHEIVLSLYSKDETAEIQLLVAESHLNLARINHKLQKNQTAVENLETALGLYREACGTVLTVPAKQKQYRSYYIAAEIYAALKRTSDAAAILDDGLQINAEIAQNSSLSIYKLEMAEALKQKGDMLKKQWEFDEALECYSKRHELILAAAHKNAHILLIAESYETLISAQKSVGNIRQANELTAMLTEFKNKYDFVFNGSVSFYS